MTNMVYGLSVDVADAEKPPTAEPKRLGGTSPQARDPNSPHSTRMGPRG